MKDGDMADQPLDGAEPFREVFDLADELVEQITDTEVEGRLRRLLEHQSANRQNQSAAPGPDPYGMSLAEAREGGTGAMTGLGEVYRESGSSARSDLYEVTSGPQQSPWDLPGSRAR